MNLVLWIAILALWSVVGTECAKILLIGTIFSGSHLLTLRHLAKSLTEVGHQVKILRWREVSFKGGSQHPKNEIILTMNNTQGLHAFMSHEERAGFQLNGEHVWKNGLSMRLMPLGSFSTLRQVCIELLNKEDLYQELSEENFSLAIVDIFLNDCGLALAYKLGVPTMGFWAFHFGSGPSMFMSSFNPPSTTEQILTYLESPLNLWERTINTYYSFCYYMLLQFQFLISYSAIRLYIPDCPYPPTLLANMSGMLINSNPALNPPILLPPSYVEVAGMHLHKPEKLPEEIEKFIESSGQDGVILFSLGIIFDAQSISSEYFEEYFRVFERLQQKVIVKANKLPKKVPDNVIIRSFLPQQDILAHNKTKLFITHCGMHSIVESVEHEVPMVGIPIFIDQKDNLIRLQRFGVAEGLEKNSNGSEIYNAINQVLNNGRYKVNIKKLKRRMAFNGHPTKKAINLIDHVIDSGGADHLKMASRHLNIFQYLCLDVLFCLCAALWLCYIIVRKIPKNRIFESTKLKED